MGIHFRKPLNKSSVTVANDLTSTGSKPSASSSSESTSKPTLSRQKNWSDGKTGSFHRARTLYLPELTTLAEALFGSKYVVVSVNIAGDGTVLRPEPLQHRHGCL